MTEYTIIGIEVVDYKNKAGNQVKGYRLHLTYDKKGCEGLAVEEVYIRYDACPDDIGLGNTVRLFYNKFGTVVQVAVIG